MKKLNITFCSFPDYSSQSKALYLYMEKKYNNEMNLVWIVYKKESYNKLKIANKKVILYGTKEFEEYIYKTDIFFTTHGNLIEYKSNKSIYIDLWHGIGIKSSGYLINDIEEDDITWINNFRNKVDFMVVPTDFWKTIFSAIFQMESQRFLPLGYPKFDLQIKSKGKENLAKVLNLDVGKYKKIIFYMPTFTKRKDRKAEINTNYNKLFNLKDENQKELTNILKKNDFLLCIKRHPSEEDLYTNIENDNIKKITTEMLENYNLDIDQILNAADILISDYSSLAIEFLFHKKKVIFINNNLKKYISNRGIVFNNYNFWNQNKSVENFNDLIKEIKDTKYLVDEEKYHLWFGNLKNGGCKEICNYIFENSYKINPKIKNYQYKFNTNNDIEIENKKIKEEILKLKEDKENLSKINYSLNYELEEIKKSKSWKIISKIRKIIMMLAK